MQQPAWQSHYCASVCLQVGGTVGYSVRLDSKQSARTRLLFCTTGEPLVVAAGSLYGCVSLGLAGRDRGQQERGRPNRGTLPSACTWSRHCVTDHCSPLISLLVSSSPSPIRPPTHSTPLRSTPPTEQASCCAACLGTHPLGAPHTLCWTRCVGLDGKGGGMGGWIG